MVTWSHVKYDSIGSGSTNGVQPQTNMSYSPETMASFSWVSSNTSTVVAMPMSSSQPVTNSRIAAAVR